MWILLAICFLVFSEFSFHFVRRCFNKPAHLLASHGFTTRGFCEWPDGFPTNVRSDIVDDFSIFNLKNLLVKEKLGHLM